MYLKIFFFLSTGKYLGIITNVAAFANPAVRQSGSSEKGKKILQERKMSTHVMVTRSKSRKKTAQSSKLRQKDIAVVEPEKKRRKKEVPKVPEFSEEASRPLYQNFSPQSPISPRLYKFPSSVDMSPRIGPISVSLKHHVHVMPPQLALNVKKNDKMKDDFLTWKKRSICNSTTWDHPNTQTIFRIVT